MRAKHFLILIASGLLAACASAASDDAALPTETPTPRAAARPTSTPTQEQPFEPASADEVLAALAWQEATAPSGMPLLMLSGWEAGFRGSDYCLTGPYRWLDSRHLLVLPIVGTQYHNDMSYSDWSHPIVVGLSAAPAWAVAEAQESCSLPAWSASLERLIEVSGEEVWLRDLGGAVTATYPGRHPLSLSPSGLRLLARDTWIDLEAGASQPLDPDWPASGYSKVAWSADEQRIFGCCFQYMNLETGEAWQQDSFPDFFVGGRGSWPGEEVFSISYWVDERYAFVHDMAFWFLSYEDPIRTVIPLFDAPDGSYVDLLTELDLETPPFCDAQPSPSAQHIWLGCTIQENQEALRYGEAYVVALPSLAVATIPGEPQLLGWSADGEFAAYNRSDQVDVLESWLFNANTGQSRQLSPQAVQAVVWHPELPIGVLYNPGSEALLFFDASGGQTRTLAARASVQQVIWQPGAAGIALLSEQDSLWWLPDVFAAGSSPQQLVGPLPAPHTVRWSPDGARLAFVSGNALYVVTLAEGDAQP